MDYVTVDNNGNTVVLTADNNGNTIVPGCIVAPDVPANTQGISVTVFLTRTPGFAQVVGVNELSAQGHAVAVVGPIVQMAAGGGVIPVAIPDELLEVMGPGDEFYFDRNTNQVCEVYTDQCVGNPADSNSLRSWLNMNYIYNIAHYLENDPLRRTVSTNSLPIHKIIEYIAGVETDPQYRVPPIFLGTPPDPWPDDETSIYYVDGDFIYGETGNVQSALSAIYNLLAGQTVFMPIYDRVYSGDFMNDNIPNPFPRSYLDQRNAYRDFPASNTDAFYHIIGFVAMEVPLTPPSDSNHEIEGTLMSIQIGEGQIDPTQPIRCDARLYAVTLWE